MSPLFSQWSQGYFRPRKPHTLELFQCLEISDIAYLIHRLARLPALVRFILADDAIDHAADLPLSTKETNIF